MPRSDADLPPGVTTPPVRVELRTLGQPGLQIDGQSHTVALTQKNILLLVYLAIQPGHSLRRDELVEVFWPGSPPGRGRYNLRQALWAIRRELALAGANPDTFLETTPDTIQVPASPEIRVDAVVLEEGSIPWSPPERLKQITQLYSGEFLEGLTVRRAPELAEWLDYRREHYRSLHLRNLTRLAMHAAQNGQPDVAIGAAERALVIEPALEKLYRLLMQLYWERGDRASALHQYGLCQQRLLHHLDVDVSDETRDLYRHILGSGASRHRAAPPSEPAGASLILAARRMEETGDRWGAIQKYRQALHVESEAVAAALALSRFLLAQGRLPEARALVEPLHARTADFSSNLRAQVLYRQGQITAARGHMKQAAETLVEARQATEEVPRPEFPRLEFEVLRALAWVRYHQGCSSEALDLVTDSTALVEGQAPDLAYGHGNLTAAIHRDWGEADHARSAAEKRLGAAFNLADPAQLAAATFDLANIAMDERDLESAERYYRQSIEYSCSPGGEHLQRVQSLAYLSHLYLLRRQVARARETAREVQRLAQPAEDAPAEAAIALSTLGLVHLRGAGYPTAMRRLRQARQLFEECGILYGQAMVELLLALVYYWTARRGRARQHLQRGLDLAADHQFVSLFLAGREVQTDLLFHALERDIRPNFAGQVLVRLGPETWPRLLRLASHESATVRRQATIGLESLALHSDPAAPREQARNHLTRLTYDPDPDVRLAAARALEVAQLGWV